MRLRLQNNKALKRWLGVALLAGVICFSGAGGTFASFNAQTTNSGSAIASGTLTMSNSVNQQATACLTSGGSVGSPAGNVNNGCNALFNFLSSGNVEPGSWSTSAQTANVAIENTGSLSASDLYLEAPATADCYDQQATTSDVTGAATGSSLDFNAIAINAQNVTVTSGSTSLTLPSGSFSSSIKTGMTVTGPDVPSGDTVSSVSGGTLILSGTAATTTVTGVTIQFSATVTGVSLTNGSSTATASSFSDVTTGMAISGTVSDSGVPSGAIVTAVGSGTITMSEPATATSTGNTLSFGGDPFCSTALLSVQEQSTVSGGFAGAGVAAGMSVSGTGVQGATTVSSVSGSSLTLSQNANLNESGEVLTFSTSVGSSSLTNGSTSVTTTATNGFSGASVIPGMLITGTDVPASTVVASVSGSTLTMSQPATGTVSPESVSFGLNVGGASLTNGSTAVTTSLSNATNYYCWYGYGSTGASTGSSQAATDGLCAEPVEDTTSSAIANGAAVTTIQLSSLSGPIYVANPTNTTPYQADSLTLTNSAGATETFQIAAPSSGSPVAYPPSTSPVTINVVSKTATAAFGVGSSLIDSSSNGHLDGDVTDTIGNFDALHGYVGGGGRIALYPVNGAGTVNTSVPSTQLASLATRNFTIGFYLPNAAGNENDLQGLESTFGLTWYMSQ